MLLKIAFLRALQSVINPAVLLYAGHYLWLNAMPVVPPYLVPPTSGQLDRPSLTSFYMFFTMIILLQVLLSLTVWRLLLFILKSLN